MSTPSWSSVRYAKADFGGVDVSGEDVDVDSEDVDSEDVDSGGWRAEGGTDLSASAKTSAVSKRSNAKRVMAKSRCCSFSLAALRCKLRKSA